MTSIPGPPPSVSIRPAEQADLDVVVRVCQAQELVDDGASSTTPERLRAEWEALGTRLATDTWVAIDADGLVIAFAQLARVGDIFAPRVWVMPKRREVGLIAALLELAEDRARVIACRWLTPSSKPDFKLFAQAASNNTAAQQALARAGYLVTSTFERMQRGLDAPPEEPPIIAGIAIRPFRVGHDEDAVYRADEEAFRDERGKTPRTFEQWSRRLNLHAESFDPALWLVAWDADEVAGAALGEAVGTIGWIHHVGVRRPWRGRGLGAALTLHALRAIYRRSLRAARLNVDVASLTNAQRLYRRLGFSVRDTYSNYEKTLSLR